METDRMGLWIILALCGVMVLSGLLVTGGPETGRQEKRDQQRIRDSIAFANLVTCIAHRDGEALPQAIAPDAECGGRPLPADPPAGHDYRYRRLSDRTFEICSTAERPERLRQTYNLSIREGDAVCREFRFKPAE